MSRRPHSSTLRRLPLCGALALALAAPAWAQARTPRLLVDHPGTKRNNYFGLDVWVLPDFDGDGLAEWAVGRGGTANGRATPEVKVFSGADGSLIHKIAGFGTINGLFLESFAGLGDVDGDGVGDYAYGSANATVGNRPNVGKVQVISGATGTVIYVRDGITNFGGFGASLAGVGDTNGDGIPDLVVGALGTLNENAWILDGRNGAVLHRVPGPKGLGDIEFGYSAAAMGDLDGDGMGDFAVGTHSGQLVEFFSGASGRMLFQAAGSASFGRSLANLGDIDGDGLSDLLVGEPLANSVSILSGADGTLLHRLTSPDGVRFGEAVGLAGDVDRDGRGDLLVGDPEFLNRSGRVQVFSTRASLEGRAGLLFEIVGPVNGDRLGASVAGGLDMDGDGRADFVTGAPGAEIAKKRSGDAASWSGFRRRGARDQGPDVADQGSPSGGIKD